MLCLEKFQAFLDNILLFIRFVLLFIQSILQYLQTLMLQVPDLSPEAFISRQDRPAVR